MRRQSLKHVETRAAQTVDNNCHTLDLQNIWSKSSNFDVEGFVLNTRSDRRSKQWISHSSEERVSSSLSSDNGFDGYSEVKDQKSDIDRVLRVLQPLSLNAQYRLHRLGGFDLDLAVPSFVYQVCQAEEKIQCSGDATMGSTGAYRLPRVQHNSRVNLPPRRLRPYYHI
uniref:Uncharacterized protein n=1 Tax=Hyaloperonospora arabidopsidis (strain Emoy2) TaxID=559515 RepID=M4BVR2_HYAAE